MRKREREREKNKQQRRRYIDRTREEVKEKEKEKEKAFSEHTHTRGVFGTARRAGRRCRGLVGVACRAWLGVGLVVVVAMSLSLFTERAG